MHLEITLYWLQVHY